MSIHDAEWMAATSLLTFSLPEYDLGSVTAQLPEGVATGLPNVDATMIFPEAPQAVWPIDTDLVFPEGCNKLKITNQCPVVHAVLYEVIKFLQAGMLFNHGFPDASVALGLIKDCLLTAADHLTPVSMDILDRLKCNNVYLAKITPLPRARICLIQSEVKECLTVITMGLLLALCNVST
ncbi:hypothetical protein EI94DRAFT_1806805 [Lactarius quietus]|nr:hypothetical protein EI94DRAFT_1806805 [Lactarius quietus]